MAFLVCATCLSLGPSSGGLFSCLCLTQSLALVEHFHPWRLDRDSEDYCIPLALTCQSALRGSCSRLRSDSYVLGSSCCSWHCGLRREVSIIIEMGALGLLVSLVLDFEILRVSAVKLLHITCWLSKGVQRNIGGWMSLKVSLFYALSWESYLNKFYRNLTSLAFPLRSF